MTGARMDFRHITQLLAGLAFAVVGVVMLMRRRDPAVATRATLAAIFFFIAAGLNVAVGVGAFG